MAAMEVEKLEYKVVMNDGPDTELLGRVRDLEFGAALFVAAVTKYPNRNVYLRHGERVIKQSLGEPKPAPPVDPKLKNRSVNLIRGKKLEHYGSVQAADEPSAADAAAESSI